MASRPLIRLAWKCPKLTHPIGISLKILVFIYSFSDMGVGGRFVKKSEFVSEDGYFLLIV